tara:strand:+ start:851 stop:1234 length:384 start_codon:yes stop_codon:yes gene_type:complete
MRRFGVQGFSLWALSINLLLLGALLVKAHRVVPGYMEYLTIKHLITRAAGEYDPRIETVTDLRVRLARLLNTNQIYDISTDDIEVYRQRDAIVIDANYDKRFPHFWILEGVLNLEDLIVEMVPAGRT